jgi:hypothetical protein
VELAKRAFPGFEQIYWLHDPLANRPFRAEIELERPYLATRDEVRPDAPVDAKWAMGSSVPGDVVWTTSANSVLLSDRAVDLLRAGRFTGWSTYPVHLKGRAREKLPPYHGLAVHGRCGPLDPSRRVQVLKQYPGGIFPEWRGLYFDGTSWDGSSFFMPEGRVGWIFVLSEVKVAFSAAHIKNVLFTPLPEIEQGE